MHKRGFTIVELLIVIVVIAILAAITMVTFGNVQRRAEAAAVNTNYQQYYRIDKSNALYDIEFKECGGTSLATGATTTVNVESHRWIPRNESLDTTSCAFNLGYKDSSERPLIHFGRIPRNASKLSITTIFKKDKAGCMDSFGKIIGVDWPGGFGLGTSCQLTFGIGINGSSTGFSSIASPANLVKDTKWHVGRATLEGRAVTLALDGREVARGDLDWSMAERFTSDPYLYLGPANAVDGHRGLVAKVLIAVE